MPYEITVDGQAVEFPSKEQALGYIKEREGLATSPQGEVDQASASPFDGLGQRLLGASNPLLAGTQAMNDFGRILGGESPASTFQNPTAITPSTIGNIAINAQNMAAGPLYQHGAAAIDYAANLGQKPYTQALTETLDNIKTAQSDTGAAFTGGVLGSVTPGGLASKSFEAGAKIASKTPFLASGIGNVLYGQAVLDPRTGLEDRSVQAIGDFIMGTGTHAVTEGVGKMLDSYADKTIYNITGIKDPFKRKGLLAQNDILPAGSRRALADNAIRVKQEVGPQLAEIMDSSPVPVRWQEVSPLNPKALARQLRNPLQLEKGMPLEDRVVTPIVEKLQKGVPVKAGELWEVSKALGSEVYSNRNPNNARANSATADQQALTQTQISNHLTSLAEGKNVGGKTWVELKARYAIADITQKMMEKKLQSPSSFWSFFRHVALGSVIGGPVGMLTGSRGLGIAAGAATSALGAAQESVPFGARAAKTAFLLSKKLKIDPTLAHSFMIMFPQTVGDLFKQIAEPTFNVTE